MQNLPPIFSLILVVAGVLGLVSVIVGYCLRPFKYMYILYAMFPTWAMLFLFYSLAVHMYQSLGGWPTSIGDRGFSSSLITHANMATGYFSFLILFSLTAWPSALLICSFVKRWRSGIFYLGVYSLSFLVCLITMSFAPSQFLYWWWD